MSRVLVTGATGFIGRATLGPLVARGIDVHAVGTRRTGLPGPSGVTWHQADLLDLDAPERIVAAVAPTHLLHLAWDVTPGAFWTSPENLRWVEASLRLVRAFTDAGGRRATLAGTCAEYAWDDRTHCAEGETPLVPATLYGAAKHGLHLVCEAHARQTGLSLSWGRIFFVFGPHERPGRLVSSVAAGLVRGEPVATTQGEQVRDFMCSIDLADAFASLLLSEVEGAVNLATGEPMRIRDLVGLVGERAGRADLLRIGERPATVGEPDRLTAATDRLHREVVWRPGATLETRVDETLAWHRGQLETKSRL